MDTTVETTAVAALATRMTIWVAMLCYAASTTTLMVQPLHSRLAFRLYAAGLGAFLLHVEFAFHTFYGWSHTTAWMETRRQTAAVTGFDSGVGIFINYAFCLAWIADALRWFFTGDPLHERSRPLAGLLHGFFLLMMINGGIVFANGPVRWFTGALLIAMAGALAYRLQRLGTAT